MSWETLADEADEHVAQAKFTWDEYEIALEDDPDPSKLTALHQKHTMHRQMAIAKYLGAIVKSSRRNTG